jgi:putative ABC transport system permease protein
MDDLITANLRSRPTRTVISIFSVAIGVILMLVIGGIVKGTLTDTLNRTASLGADFILLPSDGTVIFAFNPAVLPAKIEDKLKQLPGVGPVAPVLVKFSMADFGNVFGIDPASYDQFSAKLKVVEGKDTLIGKEVIVDELYARHNKIRPGMTITVSGQPFTVSGICQSGTGVREYVSLKTLQEINETDKVSLFLIKTAKGTKVTDLEQTLKKTFMGYKIMSAYDASLLLEGTQIPGLNVFRVAVVVVSMIISFMVILLAMYTTIFERTREIGILKSLGASRFFIVTMVLKESVIISIFGALLGTGIAELIRKVINVVFPTLKITMSADQIVLVCVLGLLAGMLGALYPAYKAAQMDPVKALTYE